MDVGGGGHQFDWDKWTEITNKKSTYQLTVGAESVMGAGRQRDRVEDKGHAKSQSNPSNNEDQIIIGNKNL